MDLRLDRPVTKKKSKKVMAVLNGVLGFGIAILIDFLYLFRQIQTSEGFDITRIANAEWMFIGIVTAAGAVIGAVAYIVTKMIAARK